MQYATSVLRTVNGCLRNIAMSRMLPAYVTHVRGIKLKPMMRQAERRFERGIAKKSKSNPKVFWSHIRQRLKTKSGVVLLLENPQDKGSMKVSDVDKANILQNQFSSVYVKEHEGDIPKLNHRTLMSIAEFHVIWYDNKF